MKIGIIGNYGATNVGDDAILTAILKTFSGHDVTVFSANPDETRREFGIKTAPLFPLGFRSLFKIGFRKSIKAMNSVDFVVVGGGGLFQDNYIYACFIWAWQIFWADYFRRPIFIYGTGIGPLKTRIGKFLTKWAYNKAEVVTVRDHYSKDILTKIGIHEQKIYTTADPAFLYRSSGIIKERTKNVFIISLRPWLKYNSRIISTFSSFLEKLKKEKNAEFIFTSMQQIKEHDQRVIDAVCKKVGGELYIPRNFSDLVQTMQSAEYAIGMRYHFLIAALLTETPLIPISYSPKIDELFKGTHMESYIVPVNHLSADILNEKLKRLSVDYNNVKIFEKIQKGKLCELAEKNADLFDDFTKTFDQE
ncbi:polysaccharide pyruvyl transferase family protein [Candidatus Peregrinibacteria bacterium]|nr:polysaccharide pyruvyl transferase family protein [Candidatus Peregrinibacteria bacterium]